MRISTVDRTVCRWLGQRARRRSHAPRPTAARGTVTDPESLVLFVSAWATLSVLVLVSIASR